MEKMQKLNEASIKGQNRKTGESFGMVIGSDKKNREGNFELTIRVMYSSRISAYKLTFNSNNELINILDYGYSMDGNPPDVKGSGSGKSVKLDKRKTITFIAKLTSPAFANKIYKHLQKVNESVNEEFKSKDSTFEKVYGTFDKRDYFNAKGLAKVQIGNFERALKKNDKGAQQILDKFKGDMDKAKDYIIQVITDRKKEDAFNQYKAFKAAVDSIQKGKPIYGAVDLVKSRIHNNSQKYTIALYSALRNKKFTKWKDVHNDVDDLIGESVNEAMRPSQVRSAISRVKKQLMRKWKQKGGYENFGQKELSKMRDKFDYNPYGSPDERQIAKMLDGFDNWAMNYDGNMREAYVVLYSPKKGVKPVTTAAYKDKKDAEKWAKDLGGITMIVKKKVKGIDEKTYGISDDNPVQFEAKYNYKADALTAYFKGKIDAKELDSIARNQFKSGIATKKELSNFLSNKFTQDVMSDTYGIPAGTLVKRVRGLMKFAEGMNEDKKQVKDLIKKVKYEKIFYDVLSTMEKTYGKRKYRIWLEKSLKDFGENPKHYDYRTNAAIEEKLFQLGK